MTVVCSYLIDLRKANHVVVGKTRKQNKQNKKTRRKEIHKSALILSLCNVLLADFINHVLLRFKTKSQAEDVA